MKIPPEKLEPKLSVADQVLKEFVSALADDPITVDVSDRLRVTLLGGDPITEARLRLAVFGDTEI